jgi:predicted polyphosphate/ATP-dependent NAD kinase
MRVLVCGGRDYSRIDAFNWLEANLRDEAAHALSCFNVTVSMIIHGGARGADEGSAQWAKSEDVKAIEFLADWKKHGRAAGPIRNQRMIDEGKPDLVIAFPGGRGTADMVSRARVAGIPIIEVP